LVYGYIQQYGGRSRRFIAVPSEGNCTEGKEYPHISILSFIEKKIQELMASNIGMSHCGMSATSITICLLTREAHTLYNAPHGYIYTWRSRTK
jgi:hypothetical protein